MPLQRYCFLVGVVRAQPLLIGLALAIVTGSALFIAARVRRPPSRSRHRSPGF
jgi:hypothetical protein